MRSDLSGFYKKRIDERIDILRDVAGLDDDDILHFKTGGVTLDAADAMRENVVGLYSLPFSIATNFRINGKDYLVPMAGEEPSVVAAASKAAKMAREYGGFAASSTQPIMIGEINIADPDPESTTVIEAHKDDLLKFIDECIPSMKNRGGGARDVWAREYACGMGNRLIVYFSVDVRDAMGANVINKVAESLSALVCSLVGGRANANILTNLCLKRISKAKAYFTEDESIIEGVLNAQLFAENDIFRAVTHNKGIMNGISSLALATGNDTRAVEASAHGYAAYSSFYRPLTKYSMEDGKLLGEIEVPLSLGMIGGGTNHPVARIAIEKILRVENSQELCSVAASVGLAQNFSALRAITQEGISKGHMRLHSKTLALMAGATPEQAAKIYDYYKDRESEISFSNIKELLKHMRDEGR